MNNEKILKVEINLTKLPHIKIVVVLLNYYRKSIIKDQTKRQVIYNSIEIGRRFVEAKEVVEHGEWSNWLEKFVEYSQRTATNLMKIFNEYGADQITLLSNNSKWQTLADEKSEEVRKMFDDKIKAESDMRLTDKVLRQTQADFKALQRALQKEKDNSKKSIEKPKENITETKQQLSEAQVSGNNEEVERLQSGLC